MHDCPGLGDALQFTSLPENYFAHTGAKLIDVDKYWAFDHNPYVVRDVTPDKIWRPWKDRHPLPPGQRPTYLSIAERNCMAVGIPCVLRHPRLYKDEDIVPTGKQLILHTTGAWKPRAYLGEDREKKLSPAIIEHILKTYKGYDIVQIGGAEDEKIPGTIDLRGQPLWTVAGWIAASPLYIGADSGPAWIASCYPRVFLKKILMQWPAEYLKNFTPMWIGDSNSHWYDRGATYFNRTEQDVGVTYSYLKL